MVGNKVKALALSAATIAAICWHAPAFADLIDPSDPALDPFIIDQGDFHTVGLNYAEAFAGVPKDTYKVQSSDGQIWVLDNATTDNGSLVIDDAYKAQTGTKDTNYYFQTGLTATGGAGCDPKCDKFPDPNPDFPLEGDTTTTWDADITELNLALDGKSLVFYFFMNEQASATDKLWGVDELAWAKVTLVDTDGILDDITLYLTNDKPASEASGGPDPSLGTCNVNPDQPYDSNAGCATNNVGDPTKNVDGTDFSTNADERWTYVSGYFCAASDGSIASYGRCTTAEKVAGGVDIENNLGNNRAGFAIWNKALSAIVGDDGCVGGGCYDALQIDLRISMTDNGFESVMIAGKGTPPTIPEPSSLAILGAALGGLALWRSRRRSSV